METPKLPKTLEVWQNTINWHPSESQQQRFQELYEIILIGNRQQNLTRITAPEDFWEKHLWDSLLGIAPLLKTDSTNIFEPNLPKNAKIIDVGTGAGFPGIPIAITNPHWNITLLDSTRKKIAFLDMAIAKLQLQNTTTLLGRAEAIGQQSQHRENYDIGVIRAVGQPSVCAEYILPLVKVGGWGILYRGQWKEEDTLNLESALSKLGGKIKLIQPGKTPISQGIRHCIYIKKIIPTQSKYPRAVGIPHQQPLK
ncbi:MAG: 16S rRNA (guanine(527)-N(7))-methyltransferase RsmG [Xenococcaceae cyanobacterium MO_207.B15]|nr:16S rRNA (guanine(527)-N(7))-methyltransferase RsmG [Xenococcaceae cyanobacterium MO_207.B15]